MKRHSLMLTAIAIISFSMTDGLMYAAQAADSSDADSPPPLPVQEQPEVLTKGPVHEAFASLVNLQEPEEIVVPVQPPENVREVPPADKPSGGQFAWVSGYWFWDAERVSFVWVSGCWRASPPKMSWVPGYWMQAGKGWKWVAGFWMSAGVREIEYVKAPPPPPELDSSVQPAAYDAMWVPGCWYWAQGQYVWRSGYWLQEQPGWIWNPSHYVWTPHGYVFVEGHWDYPLERRGILFAPVCFPRSVHIVAGFSYSLDIVVDLGLLKVNLFTRPRYSHYYFGDYYDDACIRVGIYPRFENRQRRSCYDPIFEYDKCRSRLGESKWADKERNEYEIRHNDRGLRPSVTYREQEGRMSKLPEPQRKNFQVARPLDAVVSDKSASQKFERMDTDAQQNISRQVIDVQKYREDRSRWESKPAASKMNTAVVPESVGTSNKGHDYAAPSSDRVKVPSSPIYDRQSSGNQGEAMPSVPNDENRGRYDSRSDRSDSRNDSSRSDGRDTRRDDDGQHNRSR
ncbi:MAG: YXWGXW repeat-containing protein [Victivallales bacterium]